MPDAPDRPKGFERLIPEGHDGVLGTDGGREGVAENGSQPGGQQGQVTDSVPYPSLRWSPQS